MSKKPGQGFEDAVFRWLGRAIQEGILGLAPEGVRIDRRHGLFSQDRRASIVFDIVVQVYRKSAVDPFLFWIWECKDYLHPVPVDDLEEFHAKIEQVGRDNTKGTMVSTSGFQAGARRFAKANGIGLMRVVPKTLEEWTSEKRKESGLSRLREKFDRFRWMIVIAEVIPMPLAAFSGRVEQRRRPGSRELIGGVDSAEACYVVQDSSGRHRKFGSWNEAVLFSFNGLSGQGQVKPAE